MQIDKERLQKTLPPHIEGPILDSVFNAVAEQFNKFYNDIDVLFELYLFFDREKYIPIDQFPVGFDIGNYTPIDPQPDGTYQPDGTPNYHPAALFTGLAKNPYYNRINPKYFRAWNNDLYDPSTNTGDVGRTYKYDTVDFISWMQMKRRALLAYVPQATIVPISTLLIPLTELISQFASNENYSSGFIKNLFQHLENVEYEENPSDKPASARFDGEAGVTQLVYKDIITLVNMYRTAGVEFDVFGLIADPFKLTTGPGFALGVIEDNVEKYTGGQLT